MEELDHFISGRELYVESFLKRKETSIVELRNLSENWKKYFYRIADQSDSDIAKFLDNDFDYVEGCICIWSYGREVMSFRHWDLVDQLWVYFIEALGQLFLSNEMKSEFYFPDQPLKVSLEKREKNQIILTVDDEGSWVLSQKLIGNSFLPVGITFLDRLSYAMNTKRYEEYIDSAKRMSNLLENCLPNKK